MGEMAASIGQKIDQGKVGRPRLTSKDLLLLYQLLDNEYWAIRWQWSGSRPQNDPIQLQHYENVKRLRKQLHRCLNRCLPKNYQVSIRGQLLDYNYAQTGFK